AAAGLELSQRRPDVLPQWARHHVLPRSGRGFGPEPLFGRHLGPQRAADTDRKLCVGPGLVADPLVRLVPVSLETLDAEDHSGAALANLLGVGAPTDWPAPFNDAGVREWMRGQLGDASLDSRWSSFYVVADVGGVETVVGN